MILIASIIIKSGEVADHRSGTFYEGTIGGDRKLEKNGETHHCAQDESLVETKGRVQDFRELASVVPTRKRVLDLSMVLLASPLWLSGFAVLATWIKLVSKGSVFYNQQRVGLDGKHFTIFKFRTMHAGADTGVHEDHLQQLIKSNKPMKKLDGADSRLIRGGRLIRAIGLDELPQMFNVIIGNMSLVGPRPCTPTELEKYGQPYKRRFAGLPGITGSWQVNGKNDTTFSRMIALDVVYLRKVSVRQDLWIMVRTVPTLYKQIDEVVKDKLVIFKEELEKRQLKRRQLKKSATRSRRNASLPRFTTPPPVIRPRAPRQTFAQATSSLMRKTQALMDTQRHPLLEAPSGDTQRVKLRPPDS